MTTRAGRRNPASCVSGAALVLAGLTLAACQATIPERRYACAGREQCPTNWYCVAERCQSTPPDASVDAATDAPTPDATADDAPRDGGGRRCTGPGECSDSNACTVDLCVSGACNYAWQDDTFDCDDGLFCNGADSCASGVCQHAGLPCASVGECDEDRDWCGCDDGNPCTGGDHIEGGTCMGVALPAGTLCGGCDGSACAVCCGGACRDGTQRDYCAGCTPCSGAESCRYSAGSACGHLWCCAT